VSSHDQFRKTPEHSYSPLAQVLPQYLGGQLGQPEAHEVGAQVFGVPLSIAILAWIFEPRFSGRGFGGSLRPVSLGLGPTDLSLH
jgi:hypothetical protein